MTEMSVRIPYLDEIKVCNPPMPIYYASWRGLVETAFSIRQETGLPKEKGGLDFLLWQYENQERGVETLRGNVKAKDFLKDKKAGVEEWINKLCYLINQRIRGFEPIEKIDFVMLKNGFLAYYGSFYSERMELIIYIGSREDIDGASGKSYNRSFIDVTTRDASLLTELLPQTIWIKER